jgi:hypothetical protein
MPSKEIELVLAHLNIISKKQTLKRWQRRIAQNRRMYKPINLHFSTTIVN